MQINMAGDTHVGRKRTENEDRFLVVTPPAGETLPVSAVLLVADGMGGHERGEVASGSVCDVFEGVFTAQYAEFLSAYEISSYEDSLRTLFRESHAQLRAMALEQATPDEQRELMGTTLTVGLVAGQQLILGHVGDSRAYLIRGELIAPLTEDHTIARRLVKAGKLTPEEAAVSKYRNALSQALGASEKIRPDISTFELESGDALLLCSDGLSRYLGEAELMETVQAAAPAEVCSRLIAMANERGGRDNITVVVAHFS